MAQERFFFHASSRPEAQAAATDLRQRLDTCAPADADVIVVLGGDGAMLDAMAEYHLLDKPFYGLNYGSVGFLLNPPLGADSLAGRIAAARAIAIHPLRMRAQTTDGKIIERLAFNDVSVRRQSAQSARMAIDVDGTPRLRELVGDGVLVCTPTGSTAYNYSAGGPILPYDSQLMALTPVCAFRPRRWAGALLPQRSRVDITNLEPDFRPLSVSADSFTVDHIQRVAVMQDASAPLRLLFDPDHGLEDRLFNEQFGTNCQ